jgi:hypothetical protein
MVTGSQDSDTFSPDGPHMEKTDVFLHVPKAAGSTIRSLIETNYPRERQLPIYRTGGTVLHDFLTTDAQNVLPNAAIVYGHIPAVIHNYTDRHCDYFTFLRHPVERSISFYKYVKYDFPAHPMNRKIASGDINFKAWCRRRNFEANRQTQMLAGHDNINYADKPMLEAAKATLTNLRYFGFFEEFDVSVQRCAAVFGWQTDTIEVRNLSSRSNADFLEEEGVDESDIESLKQVNRFDLELYEFARELAAKRGFA